jgi:uncharacterized protein (DUF1015 family)
MATIQPFRALRPKPDAAARVAAVPYDVVDRAEAKKLAEGNPLSFLHVTKPEIDLPDSVDGYDDRVYAQGSAALQRFIDDGVLAQDERPCLYVYALTMNGHTQTGVVLCASVAEYERNIVKKHELTRPDKENDRVRHMQALGAQSGTVFLVHRDSQVVAKEVAGVTSRAPAYDFTASDGIRHRLWVMDEPRAIGAVVQGFADLGPIYIADGHHRSAAAARVAADYRERGAPKDGAHERFLCVSFPVSEVRIMPYNRVVKDLAGKTAAQFLAAVSQRFDVKPGKPSQVKPKQLAMFLEGAWHTLSAKPGSWKQDDPVERLDVSILQSQLLAPLLGIADPRRDKRIDFVGGIRGDAELERRVKEGWAVAFSLCATEVSDLLAIADAGQIMPPKSTWFEPKLRDGLVVHRL